MKTDRACRAFTLIELLAVIAILALLVGLTLPVLATVKEAGLKSAELAAARKLMAGFHAYAADNNGRVLQGYHDPGVAAVKDSNGNSITMAPARSRYAWRLAPYVDYDIDGTLLVNNVEAAPKHDPMYPYLVSVFTSMGMNTTFVGGDYSSGAMLRPDDPRTVARIGSFCVQTMQQAAKPSQLIVFASAFNTAEGRATGNYQIFPPAMRSGDGNNIDYRHSGQALVACLDGHVELLLPDQLNDMRRWSDLAARADDSRLTPR
jgi:prepilin-type N-terminal cleavage/methylation domain-containing protein